MKFFRDIKTWLTTLTDLQISLFVIGCCSYVLLAGWLISLTNFWWWVQSLLLGLAMLLPSLVIRKFWHPSFSDSPTLQMPPMPSYPPGTFENAQDPATTQIPTTEQRSENSDQRHADVMKRIADRLDSDAEERAENAKEEQRKAEAKKRMLDDDTVYFDKPPGIKFFIKRGLWQAILAWITEGLVIYLLITAIISSQEVVWLSLLLFSFFVCVWFSIRCYGDWRWLRRRIKGNRVYIDQPANGFFLLNGGSYDVSVLDCGNVNIQKTWFERLTGWPSATVSIDTPRENKDNNQGNVDIVTRADLFLNMTDMKEPDEFRRIVNRKHDEMMLGQPDTFRRSS